MRRRKFMTMLGSVAALPMVARAQQVGDGVRQIGVLIALSERIPKPRFGSTHFARA